MPNSTRNLRDFMANTQQKLNRTLSAVLHSSLCHGVACKDTTLLVSCCIILVLLYTHVIIVVWMGTGAVGL